MNALQEFFWNIDPGYTVDAAHTNSPLQSLFGFYFAAYTHRQKSWQYRVVFSNSILLNVPVLLDMALIKWHITVQTSGIQRLETVA